MNKRIIMLQRQYELALFSDFASGAYHEDGCRVRCPKCAYYAIMWSNNDKLWFCPQCGYEVERIQFFRLIDAEANFKCLPKRSLYSMFSNNDYEKSPGTNCS